MFSSSFQCLNVRASVSLSACEQTLRGCDGEYRPMSASSQLRRHNAYVCFHCRLGSVGC